MFHCHNLIHEDNDMMRAFKAIDTMKGLTKETAVNTPYVLNPLNNLIYSNFRYTDPMLPATAAKPTNSVLPLFDSANLTLGLNVYRIFYPTANDLSATRGFVNPWVTDYCPAPPLIP